MKTLSCKYCSKQTLYMSNRINGMCESCRLRKVAISKQLSHLVNLEKSKAKTKFLIYISELILIKELEGYK